jgi:hypothetical protein
MGQSVTRMPRDSILNASYWNNRYLAQKTGWDIGYHNTIHTDYVEANYTTSARILEPGAGSAYEVAYLHSKGYTNAFALDYAPEVKQRFLNKNVGFPPNHYLLGDFFDTEESFDLVLEQTFFCALSPELRNAYAEKMSSILKPSGKLFGVLFNFEKPDGPPFGGSEREYRTIFEQKFDILSMEPTQNSIPQRKGNELVIELAKK